MNRQPDFLFNLASMKRQNTYSLPEEILNSVTHGPGLVMGLAVCIFFLIKGSASDSWIAPFSLVLYLIGVCSSYAASTIYHSIPASREKAKKIGTASKQNKPIVSSDGSLTVDLHIEAIPGGMSVPKGKQLQFQMDTFRKIIRENICHRGKKITFIHVIGDGILKAAIRKELDEVLALRCSYCVGDPAVTIVSIK